LSRPAAALLRTGRQRRICCGLYGSYWGLRMGRLTKSPENFWDRPLPELFQLLQASPAGLTTQEASRRLRLYAVEEIQKQIAITAVVIRDGRAQNLSAAELVPGDIIRLKAGDLVQADARFAGREGPACARISAHWGVSAGREDKG
jgi:hypothetical protein